MEYTDYKDLEENNEDFLNKLYEKVDEEAKAIIENSKSHIYLTVPNVLTLVKLKNGSYYCLETKKLGSFYTARKDYADMILLECFKIGKGE